MKLHKVSAIIVGVFALFCLVGGVMGFVKASSLPSLIIGGSSAVLLGLSALGLRKGSRLASFCALAISLALGIRFGIAYLNTPKIMPHLIMIILSSLSVVYTVIALPRKRET